MESRGIVVVKLRLQQTGATLDAAIREDVAARDGLYRMVDGLFRMRLSWEARIWPVQTTRSRRMRRPKAGDDIGETELGG